jgi:glycosyltransferase 2 family protein
MTAPAPTPPAAPTTRRPRLGPRGRRVLRVSVTLLVLGLCVYAASRLDLAGAWRVVRHAHVGWLALSALLNFPFALIQSLRWRVLLGPAGKVPVLSLFRYLLASRAASNLLPARAGELVRVYLPRSRDGISAISGGTTLVLERLFDAFVLVLISVPLLWMLRMPSLVRGGLVTLFIGSLAGFAVAIVFAIRGGRRRTSLLDRIAQAAESLRNPRAVLAVLGLTTLCWFGEMGMIGSCLAAVGIHPTMTMAMLMLLVINLGMALQVTPANVGPFEGSVLLGLAAFDITGGSALAMALVYHLVQVVPATLAGLEGLRFVGEARRASLGEEPPPSSGAL